MKRESSMKWMAKVACCCLTAIIAAACSNDDNPATPADEVDRDLTGIWVTNLGDTYDSDYLSYDVVLTFNDDGVVTGNEYMLSYDATERDRYDGHHVYMCDKMAGTLTVVESELEPLPDRSAYSIENGLLVLRDLESDDVFTFHRPSDAELAEFNNYRATIYGRDYVGQWVRTTEENGQTTYEVTDLRYFGSVTRYTVMADGKVYKTDEKCTTADYGELGDPKIRIYDNNAEKTSKDYWWRIEGRQLFMGLYGTAETLYTYHMLTLKEYKLFERLAQTAVISNLSELLTSTWELNFIDDEYLSEDDIAVCSYEPDGTVYYTPSANTMRQLGIWGRFKGTYTLNGNTIEQQVAVEGQNTLFTRQMNVQTNDGNSLWARSNAEAYVNGASRLAVKNCQEQWTNVSREDFTKVMTGRWEGALYSGLSSIFEPDKRYQLEFKTDGTFTLSRRNDNLQWDQVALTVSDYFVVNRLLYMRWQEPGSSEPTYFCWSLYQSDYDPSMVVLDHFNLQATDFMEMVVSLELYKID